MCILCAEFYHIFLTTHSSASDKTMLCIMENYEMISITVIITYKHFSLLFIPYLDDYMMTWMRSREKEQKWYKYVYWLIRINMDGEIWSYFCCYYSYSCNALQQIFIYWYDQKHPISKHLVWTSYYEAILRTKKLWFAERIFHFSTY